MSKIITIRDPIRVAKVTRRWLESVGRQSTHNHLQPIAVFDVDGTILHNNPDGARCNMLLHILSRVCAEHDIPITIVTARLDRPGAATHTQAQLRQCGLDAINGLFLMPERFLSDRNWSRYKAMARHTICYDGFVRKKVILNVGDRWGDLFCVGPYSRSTQERQLSRQARALGDDSIFMFLMDNTLNIKLPRE